MEVFVIVVFLGWLYIIITTPKQVDCLPLFAFSCLLPVPVVVVSRWIYKAKYDQEFIKEWILDHKPTCHDETIECMNDRIQWYKDSLRYIVPFDYQKKVCIDSLKNELNRFEGNPK
jgi:hypothetical protein